MWKELLLVRSQVKPAADYDVRECPLLTGDISSYTYCKARDAAISAV